MQDIEEIYQKYAGIVYKYIFCLTENENLAEVKFLHVFVKLLNIFGMKN